MSTTTEKNPDGSTTVTTRRSAVTTRTYKSIITPRHTSFVSGPKTMATSTMSTSRDALPSRSTLPAGMYATLASKEFETSTKSREGERSEMQGLNSRLADYIGKMTDLEEQNRKLAAQIDELKNRQGGDSTNIKDQYDAELKEIRTKIDDLELEKAKIEVRIQSAEEDIEDIKARITELKKQKLIDSEVIIKQKHQIDDFEPSLERIRKEQHNLEEFQNKARKEKERLQNEIDKTRVDLDTETLAHIDAENRRQTVEEEIEFRRQIHEIEMEEINLVLNRGKAPEASDYWQGELDQAMRDIQGEFDAKLDVMREHMGQRYENKMREVKNSMERQKPAPKDTSKDTKSAKTEAADMRDEIAEKDLKNQDLQRQIDELTRRMADYDRDTDRKRTEIHDEMGHLQDELDALLENISATTDRKLDIEMELIAYRTLMSGEEARLKRAGDIDAIRAGIYSDRKSTTKTTTSSSSSSRTTKESSRDDRSSSQKSGGAVAVEEQISAGAAQSTESQPQSRPVSQAPPAERKKPDTTSPERKSAPPPQQPAAPSAAEAAMKNLLSGQMQAKTTFTKSAKGPVAISESHPQGHFLVIENSARAEQGMNAWRIMQKGDRNQVTTFKFPAKFSMGSAGSPQGKIKIWAKGKRPGANTDDLEKPEGPWLVGANITSSLFNEKGEERAAHLQKTAYSQPPPAK